jgi:hypothetical protein
MNLHRPSDKLLAVGPLIRQYNRRHGIRLASYSAAYWWTWQDFFEFDVQTIGGCVCIFAHHPLGCFMALPPIGGKLTPVVIDKCFGVMDAANKATSYGRIENVADADKDFFERLGFRADLKTREYLYSRRDLEMLKGNAYKSKRSDVNACVTRYDPRLRPYYLKDSDACLKLYARWMDHRQKRVTDSIDLQMMEENWNVHARILKNARQLGFEGNVVEIDGKIAAYSIVYPLSEHVLVNYCEITDVRFQGLSAFIFHKTASDARFAQFDFINVMDDCGLNHLHRVKMSWRPAILEPSFSISRRER